MLGERIDRHDGSLDIVRLEVSLPRALRFFCCVFWNNFSLTPADTRCIELCIIVNEAVLPFILIFVRSCSSFLLENFVRRSPTIHYLSFAESLSLQLQPSFKAPFGDIAFAAFEGELAVPVVRYTEFSGHGYYFFFPLVCLVMKGL